MSVAIFLVACLLGVFVHHGYEELAKKVASRSGGKLLSAVCTATLPWWVRLGLSYGLRAGGAAASVWVSPVAVTRYLRATLSRK